MRALKLGKVFDIGIYIHWTFALLVAYVLVKFWNRGGPEVALYVVGFLFAMFGCVVLHELGHALTARYFGIPTRDITLYPIGGVARLERIPEKPIEELLIAIAGPAVNIALAALLFVPGFLSLSLSLEDQTSLESALERNFLFRLFMGNLILAGFNLLPAFPLDGGRVLRALLAPWLGRLRATEAAAGLGTIFAAGFVFLGILYSPMLILVGVFAYFAGRQELAFVRRRRAFPWAAHQVAYSGHQPEVLDALPAEAVVHPSPAWQAWKGGWIIINDGRTIRKVWIE